MICLEEVLLVMCAFSEKKVHSVSVAPEPLAIWYKKLEGLDVFCVLFLSTASAIFQLSVSPEPLVFW